MRIPSRYRRLDAHRGYSIPGPAIAGASDTGTDSDSPCPTPRVKHEIRELQRWLKTVGITTRTRYGGSSNIFCGKRWLCVVDGKQHAKAMMLANQWLEDNRRNTHYIHDAK